MQQIRNVVRSVFFGSWFWFVGCIGLTAWLVDPSGPLRRNELPHVTWTRPDGQPPYWLELGKTQNDAFTTLRCKLETVVEIQKREATLEQVLMQIGDEIGIEFYVPLFHDDTMIEIDPAKRLRIPPMQMAAADMLVKILTPLKLTWELHENCVVIVDCELAIPSTQCYDLAWIMANDQQIEAIQEAIQVAIFDFEDIHATRIGSGLMITATEENHRKVFQMLSQIAKLKKSNLQRIDSPDQQSGMNKGFGNVGCIF